MKDVTREMVFMPTESDADMFICPVCGAAGRHARSWQMRANALFVPRAIRPLESDRVIGVIMGRGLSENLADHLVSIVRPDALQKFEAEARIFEMHENGDLPVDDLWAIVRAFDS